MRHPALCGNTIPACAGASPPYTTALRGTYRITYYRLFALQKQVERSILVGLFCVSIFNFDDYSKLCSGEQPCTAFLFCFPSVNSDRREK